MRFYVPLGQPPGDLDGGRLMEPGKYVELTADEQKRPHNQRLITERRLIQAPQPAAEAKGGES